MCLIKVGANKVTLIAEVCDESDSPDMRQFLHLLVDEETLLWGNESYSDGLV